MLFVEDLLDGYQAAIDNIDITAGRIYNVGGGARNTMCLHDLIGTLEELSGRKMDVSYDDWRPGDQPVFVCNVAKAKEDFGWEPLTSPKSGVEQLFAWVCKNTEMFLELGL